MITIQNADKALKEYYLDAVNAQLNDAVSPFYSAIEKSADNVYGKDVKISVVRSTCGNVMAGTEDGNLPEAYQNRYLGLTVPLKNLYGTIEISDKALRASKDSAGAFVNLVNAEMEGLISSAKQNFQRMLFGDGSGKLCTLKNKISDGVYRVDNAKEYFTGMFVDVDATGTFNDCYSLYVKSVDMENSQITFNRGFNESVSNRGLYPHGSKDNELTGLRAIFESDSLYGNDKASDSYFVPYAADGGGTLTEDKLVEILDHMEEHFNSKIDIIICSYKTRRKIAAFIANQRRVVNSTDAHAGTGFVTVNDVPVYADKFCPDDTIYFLNTKDFCFCQLCDWEWLEDESGKILKQVPGKAAYTATLVKYAELVCKKPCGQAKLTNFVSDEE